MNNDPIYRYEGNMSSSTSGGVDKRILSYDTLETRRYQTLKVKQPVPHNVTRILHERCKSIDFDFEEKDLKKKSLFFQLEQRMRFVLNLHEQFECRQHQVIDYWSIEYQIKIKR